MDLAFRLKLRFKKVAIILGVFFSVFFFPGVQAYSDDLFVPLVDKVDTARVEFHDFYKFLLEQGGFLKDSEEDFDFDSNVQGHILDNGPVILSLVEWLDKNKKTDENGLLLLRKLNRYLYLEFRHFLGGLKVNKEYEGKLVGLLHGLHKFKVPAEPGTAEEKLKFSYPFQAALSKAMIFILIINASHLGYEEKVENAAYFLDKIRRELIEVKNCHKSCDIEKADINEFIGLLQTYATKEPILGPNYLKRIVIAIAIIGVIALVSWIVYTRVVPNWNQVLDYSKAKATDIYGAIIDPFADRLSNKISEKLYDVQRVDAVLGLAEQHGNRLVAQTINTLHGSGASIAFKQIIQQPVPLPEINLPQAGAAAAHAAASAAAQPVYAPVALSMDTGSAAAQAPQASGWLAQLAFWQ